MCTEVKYPCIWSRPPWTHSASPALPVPALVPALPASQRLQNADNTHLQLRFSRSHKDTHRYTHAANHAQQFLPRTHENGHKCVRKLKQIFLCPHTSFCPYVLFFSFHPSLFIPQSNLPLLSFLVRWTKDTCEAAHNPTTSFFPLVVSHPHQQSSPLNS